METLNNNVQSVQDPTLRKNIEKEAMKLVREAQDNCERKCSLTELINPKQQRYQKAVKLYQSSAEKYKLINEWKRAGMSYENCGYVMQKLNGNPMPYFQESYNCYSKGVNDVESRHIIDEMCIHLDKSSDLFTAGNHCENYAMELEKSHNYSDAILFYNKALDYYDRDVSNDKRDYLKANIEAKLFELMANNSHPDAPTRVPKMLENIATYCLTDPTRKNAAKQYFGKSILSEIYYNNIADAKNNLVKYKGMDNTFGQSPMYYLCNDIINSIENNNTNKLKASVQQYIQMNVLDPYTSNILDKIIEKNSKI